MDDIKIIKCEECGYEEDISEWKAEKIDMKDANDDPLETLELTCQKCGHLQYY